MKHLTIYLRCGIMYNMGSDRPQKWRNNMIKEVSFKANENGTMNGFISTQKTQKGKGFSSMHEEIIHTIHHTIQFNNIDFDDIQIENCVTDGTKYLILKGEIKEI